MTFYVTIALTFCAWITQSSRYLQMFSSYHINLPVFVQFTSYLCVDIVAIVLPIAFSVSAIFVLYRFIKSNQLIALQASGINPIHLLRPLCSIACIIFGYTYVSNMYWSPHAWMSFRDMEFSIKNNITPPENPGPIFSGDQFSVYAQDYIGRLSFRNIVIIDSRDPNKIYSFFAKLGKIENNVVMLQRGEKIEIDKIKGTESITKFGSHNHDLTSLISSTRRSVQENEKNLYTLVHEAKTSRLSRALLHQKIISPFINFIFAMIAFIFTVFAPYARNSSSIYTFIALFCIIAIQGIFLGLANAGANSDIFILGNYAFVATVLLIEILYITWRSLR